MLPWVAQYGQCSTMWMSVFGGALPAAACAATRARKSACERSAVQSYIAGGDGCAPAIAWAIVGANALNRTASMAIQMSATCR